MAYILTPRWARISERSLLSSAYGFLVLAAVTVLVVTEIPIMVYTAIAAIITATGAFIGAATRRFQIELVALWFVAWSLSVGSIGIIGSGFAYTGAFIACVVPWVGLRILRLTIVARMARPRE